MRTFALIFVTIVNAQWIDAQQLPKPELKGQVTDTADKVLSGVKITLRSEDSVIVATGQRVNTGPNTQTDGQGKFSLDSPGSGRYRVIAEKPGYLSQAYGDRDGMVGGGMVLNMSDGFKIPSISIRMMPAPAVSGRVLDETGAAFAGVLVQLLQKEYRYGKWILNGVSSTTSNGYGDFKLSNLRPGTYYLEAIPPKLQEQASSHVPQPSSDSEVYADTFFPGSIDPDLALPVQLHAGFDLTQDVRIAKSKVASLRGKVAGPIMPKIVILSAADAFGPNQFRSTHPASDGSFEFQRVIPGSYKLIAADSNTLSVLYGWQDIAVKDRDIEKVELRTSERFSVSGRVIVSAEGAPAVEGSAQYPLASLLRVALSPASFLNGVRGAEVQPDGSFMISGAIATQYRVQVYPVPDGFYLASVQLGGHDVLTSGLDLSGGTSEALVVELKRSPGTASGLVEDEKHQPVPSATVTLVPDPASDNQAYLYQRVNTDQTGQFLFKNVPPGTYRAYAWSDIPEGAEFDPEYLKPHIAKSGKVTLEQNSHGSIQIQLIQPVK